MNDASRARLLLAFLLICQAALLVRPHQPFNGDEPYYVEKARFFFEYGRFENVSAEAMAVERGERWGTSDWRPQGYPLFLAALSLGDFRDASLRSRVTAAQFALIAVAVWLLFEIMRPRLGYPHLMTVAAILGAIPWPYEFVATLSPDSLTASITFFSIVILWRSLEKENIPLLFVGAFLLSTTLLLRPEMVVVAPVSLAATILIRRFDRRTFLKRTFACAAAFAIVVAMQVAYRINVTGHPGLFGGLHIRDSGAFAWTNTWLGSENEAYNFIYGLSTGDVDVSELPARAFSDAEERQAVERAVLVDRNRRSYGPDIDAVFQRLAEKRRREHPFLAIVGTRIWHSVHLWVNLETSSQLLDALAHVPRSIRRPILGGLLLLKLALLSLFVVGVMRARKSGAPALIMLCASIVIGRTLVLGTALNWTAHRYMLPAWLSLIACAMASLQTWTWRARVDQPLPGGPDRSADR
jgi:hypothetical protein